MLLWWLAGGPAARAGRAQLGAGGSGLPPRRHPAKPIPARPGPGTLQVAEHPPERRRRAKEPIIVNTGKATTEGLLPRPAAIATHPLLRRRHQQPSCIGLALRVLAHAVAASTSFSSPTRSSPTPRFGAHSPLDVHPLAPARVRFRPPAFVGFGFSAVAPRPDPIGQFLPHQEHRPYGLLHGLRQLASTILFDYFAINSPGCAVAVATSHPDVFLPH